MRKFIPSRPASQSFADLDRVLRAYQPLGALIPPASMAREGVDPRVLAKLQGDGPVPRRDSLDAIVEWSDRRG